MAMSLFYSNLMAILLLIGPAHAFAGDEKSLTFEEVDCLARNRAYLAAQEERLHQEKQWGPIPSRYNPQPIETLEVLDANCFGANRTPFSRPRFGPKIDWKRTYEKAILKEESALPSEKPIPLFEYIAFEQRIEVSRQCLETNCSGPFIPKGPPKDLPPKNDVYPAIEPY